MKRLMIVALLLGTAAIMPAYAQDTSTDTTNAPAAKPEPGAEHPPTGRMDSATPTMKSDEKGQHPPTGRVGDAVPPMKPDDPASKKGPSTQTPPASTGESDGSAQ